MIETEIVEGIVGSPKLFHEFEGNASSIAGVFHRIRAIFPGTAHGGRAKWIAAISAERVPIHDAETKMFLFYAFQYE